MSAKVTYTIGMASCGIAGGARPVAEALEDEVRRTGVEAVVKRVGCAGMCFAEPLVEVVGPEGRRASFGCVTPEAARRIVGRYTPPRSPLRRIAGAVRGTLARFSTDTAWLPLERHRLDLEGGDAGRYLAGQRRIVLDRCGRIDPEDIEEYMAGGGYEALRKALTEMSPEEIVDAVERSGLRGRGGAGFPTGLKWRMARRQEPGVRYLICNGDEGDPGAFMNRAVLESEPHRVIEGMAIAARAIGSNTGYFYIRSEYPLAVRRVREAIAGAEKAGWLGENVLGTGFNLWLHLFEGAGAFVCGEETALIASLEGRRGIPRIRPPYPVEHGLWGKPTVVNNVETFACVPWIIRNGPDAFRETGTERSKGTKVFALAGQVRRGGLVEAPMGMTIREIVEVIGGGVPEGRRFKAVQIGGPSGGCIPADLADTPIDYEALSRTGTIMGSGGLVVLDDSTCMVDFARFFLPFTQNESCGKCTFCRIGSKRILEILDRIAAGQGTEDDLARLETLSRGLQKASFCGVGKTAPNPVLTSLRYFREEYEAHLKGRCPAGRCKALVRYTITDECIGCTLCATNCPVDAIAARPYEKHEIDDTKCVRCGICKSVCPEDAVKVE